MFYGKLAEFVARQTKVASVSDLQKAWPEFKKGLIDRKDVALMQDEAFDRVLDNPDNYSLKMAIGERVVPAPKLGSRSKLINFMNAKRATLYIDGVQVISPYWKNVCDDIETRLGMGTKAVGLMTPAAQPGLVRHWDVGAVAAVQLSGMKQYRLWQPVVGLDEVRHLRALTPGEKKQGSYMTVTLKPGEVLFIPRGWVHEAVTQGALPSMHVSVGIIHPDMRGRGFN